MSENILEECSQPTEVSTDQVKVLSYMKKTLIITYMT